MQAQIAGKRRDLDWLSLIEHGVSIEIMRQTIHRDADSNIESAELRIVTHRATEAALAATVEAVKGLDVINSVTSVLRVEGV